MRWIWLGTMIFCGLAAQAANADPAPGPWDQPAAALSVQVAEVLGPGEARLAIRNLSSIPADQVPVIRALLETDLKTHGVTVSGAESASSIRVTLSESARERLWVAEIVEGNDTRVTMIDLGPIPPAQSVVAGGKLTLRRDTMFSSHQPVLAMLEAPGELIILEPERIVRYVPATDGWHIENQVNIRQKGMLSRDPRGMLAATADLVGFTVSLPGVQCTGQLIANTSGGNWPVQCTAGDDPWPLALGDTLQGTGGQLPPPANPSVGTGSIKAFYNASRDYFTGVIAPSSGVDLQPFYSAGLISRPAGAKALLIAGIDGKVQLVENGALYSIAGARDWGSDFAVLHTGCSAVEQVLTSGSGEAAHDSLRAFEIPALEAIPTSGPLAVDGAITALWSAPDGKSVLAVVRNSAEQYEVDRVTAFCN